VDEREYGAMLTGKTEVLREESIVVPLCTPQIQHELAWHQNWAQLREADGYLLQPQYGEKVLHL
jgi:hypothetical protein